MCVWIDRWADRWYIDIDDNDIRHLYIVMINFTSQLDWAKECPVG